MSLQDLVASVTAYYGFDMSGNTRLLSIPNGTISDQYWYTAWGVELNSTGSTNNIHRFSGQYGGIQQSATLTILEQRILEMAVARWLSRDPIGFYGEDWNLYRYLGNNPVIFVDPDGLYRTYSPPNRIPGEPIEFGGGGGGFIPIPILPPPGGWPWPWGGNKPPPTPTPVQPPQQCPVQASGRKPKPARTPTKTPQPPCLPCPSIDHRDPVPPGSPHFDKGGTNACCCYSHTQYFTAHQAPWPNCACNYTPSHMDCEGPWGPVGVPCETACK